MMAKIEYEIIGNPNFLREAEYRTHILNFLKDFEVKFLLAENVLIHFEESFNEDTNNIFPPEIIVSSDGKSIKFTYKTFRHLQKKEVLASLIHMNFLMD